MFSSITAAGIMTALKIAGTVAAVASSAVSVAGSIQNANSAKAQAEYQAQVNRENAKIAQQNADAERQQGIEEARLQRIKTLQNVAKQQTAMAANGIDITSGTPLDVIEDTAAIGELDALQTRYNYERRALAYESTAGNYMNQANLDMISGQNAYKANQLNALSSGLAGLTSAASVASKWYGFGQNSNSGVLTGWTPSLI